MFTAHRPLPDTLATHLAPVTAGESARLSIKARKSNPAQRAKQG